MMHIDIISCQPKLLDSPLNHSIIKRAQEKNIVNIKILILKDRSTILNFVIDLS